MIYPRLVVFHGFKFSTTDYLAFTFVFPIIRSELLWRSDTQCRFGVGAQSEDTLFLFHRFIFALLPIEPLLQLLSCFINISSSYS